ncbi:MAG: hypothetical protein GEU87_15395 [Alphaproteobacteria bacterium]|nr:hypothetical protein [Alphaproteobacteria bacterium]
MKLLVIHTLIESYRLFFANLGAFARLVWFPLVAQFIAAMFSRNYVPGLDPESPAYLSLSWFGAWLEAFAWILSIPAMTAWYRLVVLGREDRLARFTYSVGAAEWRFLCRAFIFGVAALAILAGISVAAWLAFFPSASWDEFESQTFSDPVLLILPGVVAFSLARFLLVFPAVAIGQELGFCSAWRVTKGNGFRLSTMVVLAAFPSYAGSAILDYAFFGGLMGPDTVYPLAYLILEATIYWFFFTIDASVLGIAYRELVTVAVPKTPK